VVEIKHRRGYTHILHSSTEVWKWRCTVVFLNIIYIFGSKDDGISRIGAENCIIEKEG